MAGTWEDARDTTGSAERQWDAGLGEIPWLSLALACRKARNSIKATCSKSQSLLHLFQGLNRREGPAFGKPGHLLLRGIFMLGKEASQRGASNLKWDPCLWVAQGEEAIKGSKGSVWLPRQLCTGRKSLGLSWEVLTIAEWAYEHFTWLVFQLSNMNPFGSTGKWRINSRESMDKCCHCSLLSAGSLAGLFQPCISVWAVKAHQAWAAAALAVLWAQVCLGDLSAVWGKRQCLAVSEHLCPLLMSVLPLPSHSLLTHCL